MAVRGWGGPIAMAIGGAAGAGAAQLGFGYGLGVIAWLPASAGASEAAWKASLAWATWIVATSTIAGALLADRAGGPSSSPSTQDGEGPGPLALGLWRVALAVAAAVGALVTVALVAVPARAATRVDTFSPQTIAAGYAVLGVVVGLLVAIAALTSRAIATNLIVTAGWLWLLAVAAVIDGVNNGRGLASAQLGVWHFTAGDGGYYRNIYLPGAALTLGVAFLAGALAALPAARRGDHRVGVAVSGAIGPVLVAAAYFLAAPGLVGPVAEQLSAYLIAPYAVIAGLAGSVLTSALPPVGTRAGARREGRGAAVEDLTARSGWADDRDAPTQVYATSGVGGPGPAPATEASLETDAGPRTGTGRLPDAGREPDGEAAPGVPGPARGSASVPPPRPVGVAARAARWARLGRRRGGE